MKFSMEEIGLIINLLDIEILEKKISVHLPKDYMTFLLRNNGGRPNPDAFLVEGWKNNEKGSIHYFLGIRYKGYDLEEDFMTFKGRIPANLFPIACTGTGNIIVLSTIGDDKGKVYIWDHEQEHYPPTYKNIYKIAGSFKEFIDKIHYDDPLAGIDIESLLIK